MGTINEYLTLDLTIGGKCICIHKPVSGHIHRSHPCSEFRFFNNAEELCDFINNSKSFADCRFANDYIILQVMQGEGQGTFVEVLRFGKMNGQIPDPTAFDLAPWIPIEKDLPANGQRVLVFVGEKSEKGDYLYTYIDMKIYDAQKGFRFDNENIKVSFWKPLSPPEGFNFI